MNISVKKFSKKSFSLLIALIMAFSALPLTPPISVEAADGGYEVLGNVTLDPIIYTHGTYSGTPDSEYAYMNYGSTIADGSFDGECKTAVSVSETSTKTISSVEAVDVSGASLKGANLKVENGLLKGTLGSEYEGLENADKTVTLKFTFSDGTYEYHKMPVKTNPVERHFVTGTFGWHLTGYRRLIAYQVLANGSYSNVNSKATLSGIGNEDESTTYNETVNFASIYNPFNSTYRFTEGGFTGAVSNTNKIGGTVSNFFYKRSANREIIFTSENPAIYYLDLSMSNNRGITHTASTSGNSSGNYSFNLSLNNVQYYSSHKDNTNNAQAGSKTLLSSSSSHGSTVAEISSTLPDTIKCGSKDSSKSGILTLGGTAVAGDTIKGEYTFTYGDKNIYYVWNQTRMPFEIYVSDKTTVRNNYNSKLDSLKSLDSRCYTTESWTALSNALLDFEEYLNDNTDTSSKSTETLDSAYNNLQKSTDVQNQHPSYTKTQTVSPTCTEQGYDVITCSVCGQTQNINYTPAKGHSYSGIYAPTYSAGNSYNETSAYTHSRSCTDCGYVDTQTCTFVNQGVIGDNATVTCSVCGGTYTLDYTAYKAKLTILKDKLADTDRYTSSSIEAATNAMNAVTEKVRQPLTQGEVEVLVSDLIIAENLLVVKTFNITYNVYLGEDKTELKYTEELNDVPYGDSRLLSLPEAYQTDYAVTKWTRTIESSDSIIGTTTSSLTIIANSNASYNVFIKSTADPVDTNMVTATLNNKSNKVVDVAYVNKGISTVSINNSSITLTNGDSQTTLTAPSYSFYYVSGFTVNDLPVSDGSSVDINDTTVIKPIYDVKDRFTVVLDTNVKTNKGETGSVEKGWDERITVTADNADENTQWLYQYLKSDGSYSKAEVIGYGKTVSLQVTQSCKISYNNDQTAQPQVSMDYVSYDVYKAKTITAVGRYYLPENCTKVRAGVILKTSNKKVGATNTPSWDALLVQDNYKITNKAGVFEATSFVNGTNQYAINFYSSSDYETMYIGAVAYLTYTDASGAHTIYSDIATYEYNASAE